MSLTKCCKRECCAWGGMRPLENSDVLGNYDVMFNECFCEGLVVQGQFTKNQEEKIEQRFHAVL